MSWTDGAELSFNKLNEGEADSEVKDASNGDEKEKDCCTPTFKRVFW
jgi:hypothetical protein